MKLTKPKSLNEQIKEFKFEEVTPETVAKEEEEHEELIAKVMKPAEKVADEVTKETAAPDVRVKKQKRLVKDRKELACLIKEAKEKNHTFLVSRSLKEGYRYVFVEDWDDEEFGANPDLGNGSNVTVQEYRDFLEDAIRVLDDYDPEAFVSVRPNTYKIRDPFIGTSGGFIEINYPVSEEVEESKKVVEAKEEEPVEEPAPIEEIPPVEIPEVDPVIKANAAESMINNIIQSKFNEIENLKSAITTLQVEFPNDDLTGIINAILDDANVHIGMLQKAVELIKPESGEAVEAGKEKAEEIVDTKSEEEGE